MDSVTQYFLVSIQWLKIPMDGLSDSMFFIKSDALEYSAHLLLYLGPETQQGAIKKDQKVSNDIMSHFEEISP